MLVYSFFGSHWEHPKMTSRLRQSDASGKSCWEGRVQKMANMSTATCLVAAILINSRTIQRFTRPQRAVFLPICSIKDTPNGTKSHQWLFFEQYKCNHNGNSTHICPFLNTALQNSRWRMALNDKYSILTFLNDWPLIHPQWPLQFTTHCVAN